MTEPFRLTREEARAVSNQFGTPAYVVDEASFRQNIREYLLSVQSLWPITRISYASKANSTLALLKIAHQEGLHIDVASEGELRAALQAGIPAKDCTFHGNAKKFDALAFAINEGIGEIVVDSLEEILRLATLGTNVPIVIRLNPGVSPETHAKIATSTKESKFGFSVTSGAAEEAVQTALLNNLNLVGFHVHTGSQLLEPSSAREAGLVMLKFGIEMAKEQGFELKIFNLGGGRGIRYTNEDVQPIGEYQREWLQPIVEVLREEGIVPTLAQEPGRSLIGDCGVTLLEVQGVKDVGTKDFVAVDGGLYENPRPALYDAKYTVESFSDALPKPYTVVGSHCENDVLYPDVPINGALSEGDLLQVLCTGAYSSAMANNYNRYLRPPTVLKRTSGNFEVVQERETYEMMFERERVPEDL